MTPAVILSVTARHGITFTVENGALRYRAPKGALTPELRALIAEHKNSIIAHLASPEPASRTGPLSYNQQFLWFLHQLDPESAAYNVAFSARIVSAVDVPRIAGTFQKLVDRHELLRTTYRTGSDGPHMQVHAGQKAAFEQRDAAGWSDDDLDREVQRAYRAPFDLVNGPVLRAHLFTRAPEDHVLLLTVHHIACDGWSLGILLKEFSRLYAGAPAGDAPPAGVYADFALHQTGMLAGADGERQQAFWKQRLGGDLPALDLPLDRPRPRIRSSRGGTWHFSVTGRCYRDVKARAVESRTTLYAFLLASFQALLARYTSQEDIVVGTPISVRPRKIDESVVGCYINPVVIRQTVSPDSTFRELLAGTRSSVMDALDNRHYPFPLLVGQLCPVRDPGRPPIFQVMFNFLSRQTLGDVAALLNRDTAGALSGAPVAFGELQFKPFALDQEEGQVDLALEVIDDGQALLALLKYSTDLFTEQTVARMAGHFQVLLDGIVADPEQRLSALPLLTAGERQELLAERDAAKTSYPAEACLDELFVLQAGRTPGSVAVEFNGQGLTYAELEQQSRRFAEHLRLLGVAPDLPVALYIEPSLEMAVALLGILRAGGAYLPLDRKFPRERLSVMLEDAQPRVLVTLARLRGEVPPSPAQVVCVDDYAPADAAPAAPARRASRDLAYVLFTSGSTGRPKGVQIPHRAVVNFLESMRREPGITPQDTLLSVTTISFDILGLELWLPLVAGAKVVLLPQETVMDGAELARALERSGATIMQATPSTWRLLLDAAWKGSPRLKVLCGGEAWSQELAASLLSRCGSLWNMYGPTETTIWSAVRRVRDGEPVRIGRPIANTTFHVVDRTLQPLPAGVPGELLIGGDGLARGYLGRPDLTGQKFIPDPFSADPGARLYRTGDRVRLLHDGSLEFLERLDQQVKVRGYRIELGDIESALAACTGVRQAVAVVRSDGAGKQLIAYVVPAGGEAPTEHALRQALREKLPPYMVPERFVLLERLPLTPNGKIDRKALPPPPAAAAGAGADYLAPRTEIERAVTVIWQDVLGRERIGVNENFFDLGGHSLRMARVHALLRETLQREVSMVELFKYPTVESLVRHLCQEETGTSPAAGGDDRRGKLDKGRDRLKQRLLRREQAEQHERSNGNGQTCNA